VLWHVFQCSEPTFSHLLATASFVQGDDQIRSVEVEICRRIVECEVTVLSDTHEGNVNGRRTQGLADDANHLSRIVFAVDQMIVGDASFLNQPFPQITAEAGGMGIRDPDILIEMKHLHLGPVDVRECGERL